MITVQTLQKSLLTSPYTPYIRTSNNKSRPSCPEALLISSNDNTFGPDSIEREIFWAVRSLKGELIQPGAWHTPEHNGWDVPVSEICNLHNLLSKDDSDPTKRR